MKNNRIALIMLPFMFYLTLVSGCSYRTASTEDTPNTTVDFSNGPSILSERMIDLPPTKINNYGFSEEVFQSKNVLTLYPKTNKEKAAIVPLSNQASIQTEIDQAKSADWILFESDDLKNALLVLMNQHRLKLFYFSESTRLPASCEIELKTGNFINFAKSVVYLKNDVMLLNSEYPTSASYESIYIHWKNNDLKVLEVRSGDSVIDRFNLLKTLISENKTNEAIYAVRQTRIQYPDRYMDEIIDINKLYFYHLTEKAKRLTASNPEKAIEYYWDALQLVMVLEEEQRDSGLDLSYAGVMMAAESDPTISEKLIENAKIAGVLSTYIELSELHNMPITESLKILSDILNQTLK